MTDQFIGLHRQQLGKACFDKLFKLCPELKWKQLCDVLFRTGKAITHSRRTLQPRMMYI